MGYVAALLFLPAVIYSYIAAGVGWSGVDRDNVYVAVSMIGLAFPTTSPEMPISPSSRP
jgi:hypothetical protein